MRIDISEVSLLDPKVMAGLLLGAMMPALFCSLTLNAVGRASFAIINEVRRQFRALTVAARNDGLRTGDQIFH